MNPIRIGVVGSGVTGTRVVAQLVTLTGSTIAVTDSNLLKAQQLASLYRKDGVAIEVVDDHELTQSKVVVLACLKPHVALTKRLLGVGVNVVSMSDDLGDTMQSEHVVGHDPVDSEIDQALHLDGIVDRPDMNGAPGFLCP